MSLPLLLLFLVFLLQIIHLILVLLDLLIDNVIAVIVRPSISIVVVILRLILAHIPVHILSLSLLPSRDASQFEVKAVIASMVQPWLIIAHISPLGLFHCLLHHLVNLSCPQGGVIHAA